MRFILSSSALFLSASKQHFLNLKEEPQKQGLLLYFDSFLKYSSFPSFTSSFSSLAYLYSTSFGFSSAAPPLNRESPSIVPCSL